MDDPLCLKLPFLDGVLSQRGFSIKHFEKLNTCLYNYMISLHQSACPLSNTNIHEMSYWNSTWAVWPHPWRSHRHQTDKARYFFAAWHRSVWIDAGHQSRIGWRSRILDQDSWWRKNLQDQRLLIRTRNQWSTWSDQDRGSKVQVQWWSDQGQRSGPHIDISIYPGKCSSINLYIE